MSTSRSQRLPSPGAKRQRHSTSKDPLTDRTPSPLLPSKKTKTPFKSVANLTTAYWDNLSKIHLGQGALNELDRRSFRPGRITVEGQSGLSSKELSNSLKRACKRGGLDLRHLRGYSSLKAVNPALSEPNIEMNLIGSSDPSFGQHLEDNGVYRNDGHATKPQNWNELLSMLEQARPVLTPSKSYDEQYRVLCEVSEEVKTKRDVMRKIFPLIAGSSKFRSSEGHAFQNLEDLTDGSIVKLQPDIYDGADAHNLDPEVLTELRSFLKPLAGKKTPVVPNFFGVFKGPDSKARGSEQLARYAGAIGARAIHKLRSFAVEDPEMIYDNNAYTITAEYDVQHKTLYLHAHRPIKPSASSGSMGYRMTLIECFSIGGSPDNFRRGVTAFRNAREWAMRKRNECIAAANSKAQRIATAQSTTTTQNTATTSIPGPSANSGCISS